MGDRKLSLKVFGVVERVKALGVVHDFQDVLESGGVDGVLGLYDVHVVLSGDERRELREFLLRVGGVVQAREVARFVDDGEGENSRLLAGVRSVEWSVRDEELFRKVFLAGLREKHERVGLPRFLPVVLREVCRREFAV